MQQPFTQTFRVVADSQYYPPGIRFIPSGHDPPLKETESIHEIKVEVDIYQIARDLGAKAISNKTGVSRDGHVTVRKLKKK